MTRMAFVSAAVAVTLSVMLYIFGSSAVFYLTAFLLFIATVCFVLRHRIKHGLSIAAVFVLCTFFGIYLLIFNAYTVEAAKGLIGQTANLTCTVTDEPEPHGEWSLVTFKASGTANESGKSFKNIKMQMWVDGDDELFYAMPGDILTADAAFKEIDEPFRKSSAAQGIYVTAEYEIIETLGHKANLYEFAVSIRQAVRDAVNRSFEGDKRGILNGIVLGDNRAMSDELYSDFITCGVIHITAISGLHISVICSALTTVLGIFMNRRRAALTAIIPIIMVIAVTGFHASAIRAGVMCVFAFFGDALVKKTDGLNSLGIAVLIMLFVHPFYVCDFGFGLSCTATAGVIVVTKIYNDKIESRVTVKYKKVNKVFHAMGSIAFQSVGAVIFTLPLQMLIYGNVSLVAPIAGVAINAAVAYSLIIAVLGISISFIPVVGVISKVLFAILWVLLEYIETVIPVIADIPFSYVPFGNGFALIWMGMALCFAGVWQLLGKFGGKRLLCLLMGVLLVVSLWCDRLVSKSVVEISSINLQKGYCVVIYSGEKCVIIGCGDDEKDASSIYTELRLHGVQTVERIFLPNETEACTKGAEALCGVLRIQEKPYLPTTDEVYENILPSVTLSAKPYEDGCGFLVSVFGNTVLIGHGDYEYNENVDVLFTGRVLPKIEGSRVTVISGGYLANGVDKNFGKTYYSAESTLSLKLAAGKEITAYARQDRFGIFN